MDPIKCVVIGDEGARKAELIQAFTTGPHVKHFTGVCTFHYSCGLSTATIEYSSLSVCLSVCVSV